MWADFCTFIPSAYHGEADGRYPTRQSRGEYASLKVDILNKTVTEKGIDTSLAVDMLSLVDTYNVALIIAVDADIISSIERVKHQGKHGGVVEFINGYPPVRVGGRQSSSKLKAVVDFVVPIYEVDLQKHGLAFTPTVNPA